VQTNKFLEQELISYKGKFKEFIKAEEYFDREQKNNTAVKKG